MQALRVHRFASPAALQLDEIPTPEPGVGQIRVRIIAAGISWVDRLRAQGLYQIKPPLPYTGGSEFAGVIDAIGPGVSGDLRIGERVAGIGPGIWAGFACMEASQLHRFGEDVSFSEAALLAMPYGTARYALHHRGGLQAGETVFVLGAMGGVGHAAVQMAKAMGARVIAGATTPARRAAALEEGADAVLDTRGGDWKDALKALAGPKGVDVVVDPVGAAATETAFRTLGWGGRLMVVGFAAGEIGRVAANLALLKGAAMVGVDLRAFGEREPEAARENLREVFALHAARKIRPRIAREFPIAQFAEAMAAAQDPGTLGRVVVRPDL